MLHKKKPIGRLYIDRRPDEHRLIDIALMPEYRNRGIGGKLLTDVLEELGNPWRPVRIQMEKYNPALRLYRCLGFESIKDEGVYLLTEWKFEGRSLEKRGGTPV